MNMDEKIQQQRHQEFFEKSAQETGVKPFYGLGYVSRLDGSHLQLDTRSASMTTPRSEDQINKLLPTPITETQHCPRTDSKVENSEISTGERTPYANILEGTSQIDRPLPTLINGFRHRSRADSTPQNSDNDTEKRTSYANVVKGTSQVKATTSSRPNAEQPVHGPVTCPHLAVGHCRFGDGQRLYAHHLFPKTFEDTRSEAHKFSPGLKDERWSWHFGNITDWLDPPQSALSGIDASALTERRPWKVILRYACKKCLYEFATVEEVVSHCRNECVSTRLRPATEEIPLAVTLELERPSPTSPTESFTSAAEELMA